MTKVFWLLRTFQRIFSYIPSKTLSFAARATSGDRRHCWHSLCHGAMQWWLPVPEWWQDALLTQLVSRCQAVVTACTWMVTRCIVDTACVTVPGSGDCLYLNGDKMHCWHSLCHGAMQWWLPLPECAKSCFWHSPSDPGYILFPFDVSKVRTSSKKSDRHWESDTITSG